MSYVRKYPVNRVILYKMCVGKIKKKKEFSTRCHRRRFLFNELLLFDVRREGMRRVAEPGTRRGANGRKAVQRRGHVQL